MRAFCLCTNAAQSRLWFHFGIALAILLANEIAISAPGACDVSTDRVKAPYIVACGGKSECLTSDQLEIKSADTTAKALQSICLRFGDSKDAVTRELDVYLPPPEKFAPIAYPLAPLIERWISGRENPEIGRVLRSAVRGRQPVDVILVDAEGKRYEAELVFDLLAVWSNGMVPLEITGVECSPCRFDGVIKLLLPQLGTWKIATKGDPSKLALVIGDTKLPGIVPLVSTIDGGGSLSFQLQRLTDKPDNVAAWEAILTRTLSGTPQFTAGLADEKGVVVNSEMGDTFDVPSEGARLAATGVFALLTVVFVAAIGTKTQWKWVRDSYGIPDNVLSPAQRSFSLGRCQMLFWTAIVAVAWFSIGWATGDWSNINESSLILMGVSIGAAVGAVAATPARITQLVEAYATAKTAANGNSMDPAMLTAKAAITDDAQIITKDLWTDLSSDYGENTGLHRVQSMLFTIIFGFYFVWLAFQQGAMPVLSPEMLAMLGISGSAYVGFKLAGK